MDTIQMVEANNKIDEMKDYIKSARKTLLVNSDPTTDDKCITKSNQLGVKTVKLLSQIYGFNFQKFAKANFKADSKDNKNYLKSGKGLMMKAPHQKDLFCLANPVDWLVFNDTLRKDLNADKAKEA